MFEVGQYIIYGRSGICKVEAITHLNIARADKKKLYYVLAPLNSKGSRVYFPVEKKEAHARELITEKEAWALLDEIRDIKEIRVLNEKFREDTYKQAFNSGDYRQWVAMIKTLYHRRNARFAQGKKMAATDERYMKMTEEALYSELAFVLKKKKDEMETFITEYIQKKETAIDHT